MVSLTRKTIKDYYSNLDEKCVIDNKKFWKTVKPFLSDKTMMDDNITLVENDEITTDDLKVAEIFNNFFSEIVPNLNITTNEDILTDTSYIDDPVLKAIKKYEMTLDINFCTNAKFGQKVLFRELAKSAYFRSASSDRDNK